MTPSPWSGIGWCAAGLFAFLVAAVMFLWANRTIRFWWYSNRYVAVELEVTRYHPSQQSSSRTIEGIIHPSGERVAFNPRELSVRRFNGPNDITGRDPTPAEIEGQRLPICYWPRPIEEDRWWHPAAIVAPGTIEDSNVPALGREVLIGIAFAVGGAYCFRRGSRILKASVPTEIRWTR